MPVFKSPIAENVRFEWLGDQLSRRVASATRAALKEIGDDMVETAKELVHVDTSHLQSRIVAVIPRRSPGSNVYEMSFGVFDVGYAFWQEVLPHPVGKPYIRPAAEQHLHRLSDLLEEKIRGAQAGFSFTLDFDEEGFDQ